MFASRLLRSHLKRRCLSYGQSSALKIDVLDRLVYNSVLQSLKTSKFWKNIQENKIKQKHVEIRRDVEPVSLQFLDEYSKQDDIVKSKSEKESTYRPYNLPYSIVKKINSNNDVDRIEDNEDNEINYDSKCNRCFYRFSICICLMVVGHYVNLSDNKYMTTMTALPLSLTVTIDQYVSRLTFG